MQLPLSLTCIQAKIVPGEPDENTHRAQSWLARCSRTERTPQAGKAGDS